MKIANTSVKSNCEEEDQGATIPVGNSSQKRQTTRNKRHLNDRLLGQHGGDLLVYLPSSERLSLLGIIVQGTNMTFSHVCSTEDELKRIQNGNYQGLLDIVNSRTFNFLKKVDRKELINAFFNTWYNSAEPF